ncbi:PPA1309 family protein [uncultured Pseudokineococcus sp.]|uniref:PPA1309 family protein n=1 Tax=uncultured Pseudokineococcus sp. TaxID=1642928 RepID=UPI00261A2262|nr:PPA1309 family protein [uncultured Pseudokineococcus sp.]
MDDTSGTPFPDDERATLPVPPLAPLERTALEVERHVATAGWDAPPRVFALLRTAEAVAVDPTLADVLPADVVAEAVGDPDHLTSVEQEELPEADGLEDLLGRIGWPSAVAGAAVVVERVVVPPTAELPEDPAAALAAVEAHPERRDVRIAVAVLRDGSTGSAVRQRADDDDLRVVVGEDLVPGLSAALRATLAEE